MKKIFVLLLALSIRWMHAGIVFDLKADWSDSNNPNGAWSLNDGHGAITNHVANYAPGAFTNKQPAWARAATGQGHIVSWLKAGNNGYAGACTDCRSSDWREGDILTHTWDTVNGGLSAPHSNVSWTSPGPGKSTCAASSGSPGESNGPLIGRWPSTSD